jgi:hypothetical protein
MPSDVYEPYLYSPVSRTFLKLGTILSELFPYDTMIGLIDHQHHLIGTAGLHIELEEYEKASRGSGQPRVREFIAISRGIIVDSEDTRVSLGLSHSQEWKFWTWAAANKNESEVYGFYNVLCIEWDEGIAYRCGIGRVAKAAWERQNLEQIDIKLG